MIINQHPLCKNVHFTDFISPIFSIITRYTFLDFSQNNFLQLHLFQCFIVQVQPTLKILLSSPMSYIHTIEVLKQSGHLSLLCVLFSN